VRQAWFGWRACTAVVLAALAACEAGPITSTDGTLVPPDTTPGGGGAAGGGGTIQRATLTATVAFDSLDAPLAAAVGIAIEGLIVRLTRTGSADSARVAVTNANGQVQFDRLLQGDYQLSVDRPLTPAEVASLPPDSRDASIFAGGAAIRVTPPSSMSDISLVASRRGSLVISELFLYYAYTPIVGVYGTYLELYNNSDTTIYLDGLLLFDTWGGMHVNPRCTTNEHFRLDPTAVWAYWLHRFPGSGRQFAVPPGETRVVATDAIDHSLIDAGMQDLRNAHFEFIGNTSDPNNPAAADMIRLRGIASGHGSRLFNRTLTGIALGIATDTSQLERRLLVTESIEHSVFRIPREAVLDATAHIVDPAFITSGGECMPFASSAIDGAPSQITNPDVPLSIRRRSLGIGANGAEILQRTRNSARDFELAPPLLRSLRRR
jgi:hypothetical protein